MSTISELIKKGIFVKFEWKFGNGPDSKSCTKVMLGDNKIMSMEGTMFGNIFRKIKNYGVSKAIDSLDYLEKPLGDKIKDQINQINTMDSYEMSKWIVDHVQNWLREHFGIPQPEKK